MVGGDEAGDFEPVADHAGHAARAAEQLHARDAELAQDLRADAVGAQVHRRARAAGALGRRHDLRQQGRDILAAVQQHGRAAFGGLQRGERGVAVLLNCGEDAAALLPHVLARSRGARAPATPLDLRTYGIGAQILRDLGVGRMKLLGSPRRMPSLLGYGLEVSGYLADEPVVEAPAAVVHAQR